jgi:hypothetical protein
MLFQTAESVIAVLASGTSQESESGVYESIIIYENTS